MKITKRSLEHVRRPEYTGENRCPPCTVVNLLVAAGVSALVGIVSTPLMVGTFALFVGIIYLRGYLVPGTPALTRRYLPNEILVLFDERHLTAPPDEPTDAGEGWWWRDTERVLREAGALAECRGVDDLCLTDDFRDAWFARIETMWDRDVGEIVAGVLGVDVGNALWVEETERSFVARYDGDDGFFHGEWPSKGAFVADLAAERELRERYDGWAEAKTKARIRVAESLRVFLDRCPACDGAVTMAEESVESCCLSKSVLVTTCDACGARLFEIDVAELA